MRGVESCCAAMSVVGWVVLGWCFVLVFGLVAWHRSRMLRQPVPIGKIPTQPGRGDREKIPEPPLPPLPLPPLPAPPLPPPPDFLSRTLVYGTDTGESFVMLKEKQHKRVFLKLPYLGASGSVHHTNINIFHIESVRMVGDALDSHTEVYMTSGKVWRTPWTEDDVFTWIQEAYRSPESIPDHVRVLELETKGRGEQS